MWRHCTREIDYCRIWTRSYCIDDTERSGRQNVRVEWENLENVHKIVSKDCKMNLCEITDTVKRLECMEIWASTSEYSVCSHRPETTTLFGFLAWLCDNGWTVDSPVVLSDHKHKRSAGKTIASVFWNAFGILSINYFEKDKIINSVNYMTTRSIEYRKIGPTCKRSKCSFTRWNQWLTWINYALNCWCLNWHRNSLKSRNDEHSWGRDKKSSQKI